MKERFAALGYRVAFGPPVPADRAEEAAESLAGWLEWQLAHTTALAALQTAESVYHRLAADRFGTVDEEARRAAVRDALVRVDDLRRELDDVRGRKPWRH